MRAARLLLGDCREVLKTLPERSVHCCVTSPPYYGLRDYKLPPTIWGGSADCEHTWSVEEVATEVGKGNWTQAENGHGLRTGRPQTRHKGDARASKATGERGVAGRALCALCGAWRGCLGLEPDVHSYVAHVVEVFRAVWRVLRDDGTLWLNLGDSYANDGKWGGSTGGKHVAGLHGESGIGRGRRTTGLKPKSLMGVPWRVALALEADGWYLRSEIIYSKPAPMPESVRDRPTRSHEHIFLLTKQPRYFYDADAVREPISEAVRARPYKQVFNAAREDVGQPGASPGRRGCVTKAGFLEGAHGTAGHDGNGMRMPDKWSNPLGRNLRTVWEIGPEPCPAAHFATFPSAIPRTCILAGTSAGGCCSTCGAPWKRIAVRIFFPQEDVSADHGIRGNGDTKGMDAMNRWQGSRRGKTITLKSGGWEPTCKCTDASDPVSCTVLDPFMGSGRTGVAALGLGRSFVGIDLSQTYLETIARPAIAAALMQDVIGEERDGLGLEVDGQQRGLFGA